METPIKASIKSLEGQSVSVILTACLGFIYVSLNGGSGDPNIPQITAHINELLQQAHSAKEIGELLAQQISLPGQVFSVGKIAALLVFMYKVYIKFLDSRTELKKASACNELKPQPPVPNDINAISELVANLIIEKQKALMHTPAPVHPEVVDDSKGLSRF